MKRSETNRDFTGGETKPSQAPGAWSCLPVPRVQDWLKLAAVDAWQPAHNDNFEIAEISTPQNCDLQMSNIKRTFDQLGIHGLSHSNKRSKSPQPAAQTPNSTPSSTQTPSTRLHASKSVPSKSKTTGHAILSTLKGSMKLLRKGCEGFAPLGSAVDTLLEVLSAVETTAYGSQSHALHDLATDLPQWAIILSTYVSKKNPEGMSRGIEHLAETLREQAEYIRDQQQLGKLRQISGSENELEELQGCYRRIESAFQQLQTDSGLNTWRIVDTQLKDSQMSRLSPAYDARYNSSFSDTMERHTCFENTRVTVLDEVRQWIYSNDGAKIYWMNGMAGTGKTTIAYSICAELEKNGLLAASFFCSRTSSECSDVSRILPTIAHQLAQRSYPFRCVLCQRLSELPDIGQCSISVQFESLIQQPLLQMKDVLPGGLVVVIDALDECSNPKTMGTMLRILLDYAVDLPIRFFLTSRPEPSVSTPILSKDEGSRSILHLHDVVKSLVQDDIETYLTVTLATLSLPVSQIKQLTDQAGILFIYAATVSRYILAAGCRNNAMSRLAAVLTADANRGSKKDQGIDKLYRSILVAAMDPKELEDHEVEIIQRVLWMVVCVKEPVTTTALADLLGAGVDEVMAALDPLRSVVNITQDDSTVSTLHASFPDFLLSPERSKEFHCEPQQYNAYLAARCFWHMERSLRFNICDLETSFRLDQEVPDLERRVEQAIPLGLFYACLYWSDHLASTTLSAKLLSFLERFLKHRLLFWMEVLSLEDCGSYAESILSQAVDQLSKSNDHIELRDFAHDARNFATTFAANPCSLSTPHIYISVLPFTSRESRVWKSYWPRMQGLIQVEGVAMDAREQSALATWAVGDEVNSIALSNDGKRVVSGVGMRWSEGKVVIWNTRSGTPILELPGGHSKGVASAAFSPDDTLIVSGSYGGTICIWDATRGELIASSFKKHSEAVTSVAFSTDGARLASGSNDSTIQMWDAHSGAQLGEPLKGHRDAVKSVAFSPNGVHLASSSSDHTIRVWDIQAGTVAYTPIKGHTDAVNSIAYSHDGLRLVSGSSDCTVRVWDMSDGTPFSGPFEGHTDGVTSVSFSLDGTRVVSGSKDRAIRVWETVSGILVAGPLEGHSYRVNSVLFTADGTRILSGSVDHTIRVWDARQASSGATQSLRHTSSIDSIALSPDGTRVTSALSDRTICVWDAHNGALAAGPFTGHSSDINSVAFSPDGARIVSGSSDHTLRIWEASTGGLLVDQIQGHTGYVSSVAFSPDGSHIASGSDDLTIRLWNSHTGESVAEPFEGHTDTVTTIAFSPNGARIVSGSEDHTVQMWDASNGTTLWTSDALNNAVLCVAISPDGTRVVSGSFRTILVRDAESGKVVAGLLDGHTDWVWSVAFSPDGIRVVSGSDDRTVRVWDVESETTVAGPLGGHTDQVMSVAVSPDGMRIISGSWDHTIRIWDVAAMVQASSTSRDDWSLDESGWLIDSNSQRLFWVPSELRARFGFLTSSNPIVINADCTTRIDDATLLGDRWHGCYNASPVSVPG